MRLLGKILLLCFTLYSLPISAQKHQWAKSLDAFTDSSFGSFSGGGSFNNRHNRYIDFYLPYYSKADALDLDSANNVYVAGFYRDSMQIDSFTAGSEGNVHLSKFDSRGNHKWTQTILSRKQPVNISDVLVVHNNRILIYGHVMYDSSGVNILFSLNDSIYESGIGSLNNSLYFIIEFDSMGNILYYQKIFNLKEYVTSSTLGITIPSGNNVIKDKDNNLIFTVLSAKDFSNTIYTRNGTLSYNNSNYWRSQLLLKYSTHFDSLLWMKTPYDNIILAQLYSMHTRMSIDTMGNLYVFPVVREGDQVFLNGITHTVPKYRTLTKNLVKSLLVILNPDGDLIYADFFSSLAGPNDFSSDMIEDIVAIDTNRFYIIGYMSDTLRVANQNYIPQHTADPDSIHNKSGYNIVLPCIIQRGTQKLDWVTTTHKKIEKHRVGGSFLNQFNASNRTLLKTDNRDGIYASFTYSHNHDISIGGLSDSMTNIYDLNPTVFAKFDTLGNALWLSQRGDVKDMQPTNLGEIVYCGFYKDSFTLDPFVFKSDFTSGFVAKMLDYSITRGPVSAGPYCAGDTLLVPYTIMGEFDTANWFIAELSDEHGNFERGFRELGRLKTNQDSVIIGTLPLFQVASSAKYRIRVRATHPAVQSFYWEDTLQLLIYSRDKADPGPQEFLCFGDSMEIETFGGTEWKWSPNLFIADTSARKTLVFPPTTTTYRIVISDSSGCGEADTAFKKIIVRDKPQIAFEKMNYTACIGDTVFIPAGFSFGDSAHYHYQWFAVSGQNWQLLQSGEASLADTFSYRIPSNMPNSQRIGLVLSDACYPQNDTVVFTLVRARAVASPALLSVLDSSVCSQRPTILYANLPDIPKMQWYWLNVQGDTLQSGFNALEDSLEIAPVFLNNQPETYRVVTLNSCVNRRDTSAIILYPKTPLQVFPSVFDTMVCSGQTIKLKASGKGGDSSAYAYRWQSKESGMVLSEVDSLDLKVDASSVLQLILTDGCMLEPDTAEILLDVRPGLQVDILNKEGAKASDTTVCFGAKLEFFAKGFGGDSTNYLFEWLVNDSLIGTDSDVMVRPSNHHHSPSILHLITQDACSPPDTQTITINILPPLSVTLRHSKGDTLCAGEVITLFAQATGGIDSAYSYQWLLNGAFVSDLDSFLLTGIHPSPSTLQLILSDGCSSPNDTFTHTFFIRPSLTIDLSASTLCANPTTTLTANPSGGKADNYTIQWFDEAENMIGTGSSIAVTPSQLTTYHAILRDGCSQTQAKAQIQIDRLPDTLILSASPTEGCEPLEIEFEIYTNYRDSFSGVLYISDTDSLIIENLYGRIAIRTQAIHPLGSGIYTPSFQFISKLGCTGISQNAPTITVHPKPTASFRFEPDSPRLDNPEVRFQNLSTGATSYQWELPPLGTFTDFEPTVRYSETGRFSIMHIAISDQDCRDTAMGEVWIQDVIRFFMPTAFSPNGDGINDVLSPSVLGLEVVEFNIFNRWGARIFSSKGQAWDGTYRGQPVQDGVYTYTLVLKEENGKQMVFSGTVSLVR